MFTEVGSMVDGGATAESSTIVILTLVAFRDEVLGETLITPCAIIKVENEMNKIRITYFFMNNRFSWISKEK